MYNYRVDEQEIDELLKASETSAQPNAARSEQELIDTLNQIEKENGWSQGEIGGYEKNELNLERMDAGEFSEDEARSKAENYYGQEQIDGKASIEDNAIREQSALEKQKTTITDETEKNKAALEEIFGNRKEEAKKDALNRGLARSTIIINKIEAFDEKMLGEYNKLNIEYSRAFTDIENSLNMLQVQKENALKNFDLSYAVKINQKIDELKKEYEKKSEEVAKYNNDIALKETEWNAKEDERAREYDSDVIDKNTAYWDAVKKYGADVVNKQMQDTKFSHVEAYFKSLPKDEAFKVLTANDYWLKQIGSANFIKLANELGRA